MHRYLPVLISALTVLILGCLNLKALQSVQNDQRTGHPSYLMLSLAALAAGLAACYLLQNSKMVKMELAEYI